MSAKQHIAACFDVLWIVQTSERVVYNPRERDLFWFLLFGRGVKNVNKVEREQKKDMIDSGYIHWGREDWSCKR